MMDKLKIKSKFDAEYRRISLPMTDVGTYEHFRTLIESLHKLNEVPFVLSYVDPKDGHILPINNDDSLGRAVLTAKSLLRIIIQRKERISYPSGAMCLAGVKRLRLLGALKRCGLCHKRNPFKCVVKCRGCKMVYHRSCGERISAAAVTVEDDRDVLVEELKSPASPTATCQESTTTVESPIASVRVAGDRDVLAATGNLANPTTKTTSVRVEGDRDILAAERRRLAVHAAERRQRADHLAATGNPANPKTRTVSVQIEGDRAILAAKRRRLAVRAAERRQRADHLAATGSPANPTMKTASVRVEGDRDILAAKRRRRAVRAAERRQRADHFATTGSRSPANHATKIVESRTVEPSPTCVHMSMITASEYFQYVIAERAKNRRTSQVATCCSLSPDRPSKPTRKDYEEMSAAWDPATFMPTKKNEWARIIYTVTIHNSTITEATNV